MAGRPGSAELPLTPLVGADHACDLARQWKSAWQLGLTRFEPGDVFRGRAQHLDQQLVAGVDPESGVGGFDGDRLSGVADPYLDLPSGNADAAAAADPPVDPNDVGGWDRGRPRGTGVANPGYLGCGEWVQQGSQHGAVGAEQAHHPVLEADSDALPGEVEPGWVLPSGQGERAGGIDGAFDLDRGTGLGRAGADRRWPGRSAVVGQQLVQVGKRQPGRDGLEADPIQQQVDSSNNTRRAPQRGCCRRSSQISTSTPAAVCVGDETGRLDRSARPADPSSAYQTSQRCTACRDTPNRPATSVTVGPA